MILSAMASLISLVFETKKDRPSEGRLPRGYNFRVSLSAVGLSLYGVHESFHLSLMVL